MGRFSKLGFLALGVLAISACGKSEQNAPARLNNASTLSSFRFDYITATGQRIFEAARTWMDDQVDHSSFPKPAQCANNVSHVLEMAGIGDYSSPLVPDMVDAVESAGGKIVVLPKDSAGLVAALNKINNGRIPVGTLVSGCLNQSCSGSAGDGHIGMVGDIDASGNILVYHNNWYRPDNNNGAWLPNMVSKHYYYDLGLVRQWMPTPWLKLSRDTSGRIIEAKSALPAIDDLDPRQYFVTLSIMPEILKESPLLQGNGGGSAQPAKTCTVVSEDGMNVRAEPNGDILTTIANGKKVTVLAQNGRWYKVKLPEGLAVSTGWIHDSGLSCQ